MAQTEYVVANKLHKQANAATAINRPIAIVLFVLAVLAFLLIKENLLPPIILGGAAIFFLLRSGPDDVLVAGAVGEDQAMQILTDLPDSFILFNQLDIPNAKSSTGVNEADIVVCGPTAIFVIEVKNNNGTIVCDETSPQWKVAKVGRKGGEYEKEMRNPIAQTKQLVWLLGEQLKKVNAKPWIQGVVVFTNPAVVLEFNGRTSMPVLRSSELKDFLISFQGNSRPEVLARAKEQLIAIRKSGTAHDASPRTLKR